MTRGTLVLLAVLAAGGGCSRETGAREPARPASPLEAGDLAALVERSLGSQGAPPACGATPVRPVVHAFYVTAETCLGCLEVGVSLRGFLRDVEPDASAALTPARHTAEVCEYFRREKVRVPVFALDSADVPEARAPRELVYFSLDTAGRVAGWQQSSNPAELIDKISRRE